MLTVLSSNYFGNIQYFSKIIASQECVVDIYEHYTKQTYRNRCDIMGANGRLSLSVPIHKIHNSKTPLKDCKIDYSTDWQRQHLRSIVSAYKNSPYFDYFFDRIEPIISSSHKYLLDINNHSMNTMLDILSLSPNITFSKTYVELADDQSRDYRSLISPKCKSMDDQFNSIEYYQVFSENHPFESNLSILDLLFCEGRGTVEILKQSFNKNL